MATLGRIARGDENLPASLTQATELLAVITGVTRAQAKDASGFVSQACSNGDTCDPATQPPGCTATNRASSTTFVPFRTYSFRELSAATGSAMNASVRVADRGDELADGSGNRALEMLSLFVNGQWQPGASVATGEVTVVRFVHATGGDALDLKAKPPPGGACEFQTVAWDGVYLRAPEATDRWKLLAGSRDTALPTRTLRGL